MRRGQRLLRGACAVGLAAALAGIGCAGAGSERAARPAATTATPLFWHAQAPGGGDFYLLGSVHVRAVDAPAFGPEVAQAYQRSDQLVVEIDVSQITPEEIEAQTQRYAMLPPQLRLDALLEPETRELLARFVKAHGMSAEQLQRYKPWFASQMILMTELSSAGYDAALGVDKGFVDQASGEKPITGLETLASQFATLDGQTLAVQELMLRDVLLRSDALVAYTGELLDAWSRGDEAALESQIFRPADEAPELVSFYASFFWQRNAAMAARLVELARDGQTRFVVLGAGHMLGEKGIPALLAQRGFVVERVLPGAAARLPDAAAAPPR